MTTTLYGIPAGAETTARIIYLPAVPPATETVPVDDLFTGQPPAVVVKPFGGRGRHRAPRRLRVTYHGLVYTGLTMMVASGAVLGWIFLQVGA